MTCDDNRLDGLCNPRIETMMNMFSSTFCNGDSMLNGAIQIWTVINGFVNSDTFSIPVTELLSRFTALSVLTRVKSSGNYYWSLDHVAL